MRPQYIEVTVLSNRTGTSPATIRRHIARGLLAPSASCLRSEDPRAGNTRTAALFLETDPATSAYITSQRAKASRRKGQ
jgi:hypothetical protein